ncbi:MAG: hypothetical protein M1838_000642 [Thelocarpon superellum]|nr:MAG: hypothetical protein M1838_000642 [Thelocarpon superellum]
MRSQEAPSATPFDATSNNAGPNAPEPFLNPVGILGVEGVYDLVGLRDRHFESSIYQDIVTNAFGLDEREWRKASPTTWLLEKASLAESWPEGRVLVIAQSHEDGLVEDDQATELLHAVGLDGNRSAGRKDELMWLRGLHDQIWEEGHELAAAILHSICLLAPPSSRLS